MSAENAAQEYERVREHLLAFQSGGGDEHLDAAVDLAEMLLAKQGDATDPGQRLQLETYASTALVLRSRSGRAQADDLRYSIKHGRSALQGWPSESRAAATLQANLASSLSDLYEHEHRLTDLEDALDLYSLSVVTFRALGVPPATTLHNWGSALHERAKLPGTDNASRASDLDHAVALFTEALEQPGVEGEERAEILNSLGLSRRAQWTISGDRGDLAAAEETLQEARELATPGGEVHAASSSNLAMALQDHADVENDPLALQEAVDIIREALRLDALSTASTPRQPGLRDRLSANLQTALVGLYWYSRDSAVLEGAVTDLRSMAADLSPGDGRTRVEAVLGAVLHETFERTGSIAALDRAVVLQERVLEADGEVPTRMLNLGVSLLARFRRRHRATDVERAFDLFLRVAECSDLPVERASAWNSAANALFAQRALTPEKDSIDEVVALRRRAVSAAPDGSLDNAIYRGNLGVDLLARYESTHDGRDLTEALESQRKAVQTAPGSTPPPTLLAGLADTEALEAERSGGAQAVQRARAAFLAAFEAGRASQRGTALGSTLNWGSWEARGERWSEALEAHERGLAVAADLVGGQESRADKDSWLRDAQEISAAGAFAGVRAGELRRAVVVLERGRAVLLAEALLRRTTRTSDPRHQSGADEYPRQPQGNEEIAAATPRRRPDESVGLDAKISTAERALATAKPGSRERAEVLNRLAMSCRARWETAGKGTDLDRAIKAAQEATTCDASDAEGAVYANTLGNVLANRYERDQKPDDLEDAIVAYRDAVATSTETMRAAFVANLAGAVVDRFRLTGKQPDIDEALCLMDEVAADESFDDPEELAGLAANRIDLLNHRYQARGSLADIEDALQIGIPALGDARHGTTTRTTLLTNLGGVLLSRYEKLHDPKDLASAIEYLSSGLDEISAGAPGMSRWLNNQGAAFAARAKTVAGRQKVLDLDRAVEAHRGAVQAASHGARPFFANGLAGALLDRYQVSGAGEDLQEAMQTQRRVLRSTPRASVDYPRRLGNLAGALALRHGRWWWATGRVRSTYRRAVGLALQVDSESALVMGLNWGRWELERGAPHEAADAFDLAAEGLDHLFAAQLIRPHKEAWLSVAADLSTSGAWAHALSGDLPNAVVALERGRAALLAEALGRNRADLRRLEREGRQDLAERFRAAASKVTFHEEERV